MKRCLLAAIFSVMPSLAPALTSVGAWYRLPLWGADVTAIAVDPFHDGLVYCGTSRGNVYISVDSGASWTPTRPGNQFPGYVVSTLRTDRITPDTLWAALSGSEHGALLAQSVDRGATWNVIARWEHSVNARAFAQSPVNPDLLACGGDDGVFLSDDGGKTWRACGTNFDGLQLVESLAFDPRDPKILFCGTYRQAFRTRDGGATWERIAAGMVLDATVYSFDFELENPSHLWVSTCGWVYRSVDSGDHWTRFVTGFTNRRAPVVRIDPRNPEVLFAATVGGLHRSDNGGKTWIRTSRDSMDISSMEIDPKTQRLYLGTLGEGLFVSDDGGATLSPASDGLAEARIPDLAADPLRPSRILFLRAYGGLESGVWEADGGLSRRISSDAPAGAFSLAASRIGTQSIWLCASASALRVSLDGGHHFAPPVTAPRGRILRLFGEPLGVPVVVTDVGVFTTRDGAVFEQISAVSGAVSRAGLVSDDSGAAVLEVATSEGVFRGQGAGFVRTSRRRLSGGIFLKDSTPRPLPYFNYFVRSSTLMIRQGNESTSLVLPRESLAVSGAIVAGDGSLYLATMGDGLFRYRPETLPEGGAEAAPSATR